MLTSPIDANQLRRLRAEFPILSQRFNGSPLIYLDNAATTQKPRAVIDSITQFYRRTNANVHRSAHQLSHLATQAYEGARDQVANYLCVSRNEVIWTSGATEAINLVAYSYLIPRLSPGDHILLARSSHHANILPWQHACSAKSAMIDVLELDQQGDFDLELYQRLLEQKPKLVALPQVSNVLGTIYPIQLMCQLAKEAGALVFIDGAQSLPHFQVDLTTLGADFFTFSGHKLFGPTGTGVLWGRYDLLETMQPWKTGGEMIENVSFEGSSFSAPPYRFEAGTPNIAGVVGLGSAIQFLSNQDRTALERHEQALLSLALEGLESLADIQCLKSGSNQVSLVSFTHPRLHAQDIAKALDQHGIAVRAGQHCAQPLLASLGIESAVRASFAFYNSAEEIGWFIEVLDQFLQPTQITNSFDPEQLVAEINQARGWAERYMALLTLGTHLPIDNSVRTDDFEIPGCETRVWMQLSLTDEGKLRLTADAQAKALRALLYLIKQRVDNSDAATFELQPLEQWVAEMGFENHLSRTRGNSVRRLLDQLTELSETIKSGRSL